MAATPMSVHELASAFVQVISGEGVDPRIAQSMAPEIVCWHNHHENVSLGVDGPHPFDEVDDPVIVARGDEYATSMAANIQFVKQVLPDFRAEDVRIHVAESSFVLTSAMVATPPSGRTVRVHRSMVFILEDGLVRRIDIYEDWANNLELSRVVMEASTGRAITDSSNRAVVRVESS